MKALYVFHRIFHYLKVWDFIAALGVLAFALFSFATSGAAAYAEDFADVLAESEQTAEEYFAAMFSQLNLFALVALALVALGVFHFAFAHIFKMAYKNARKHACECECCEKAPASDLDAQVEEVMRWKNLYVEGIITEREFIDKRNEILRIAK